MKIIKILVLIVIFYFGTTILYENKNKEEVEDIKNLLNKMDKNSQNFEEINKIKINSQIGLKTKELLIRKSKLVNKYDKDLDFYYNKIDENTWYKNKDILKNNIEIYSRIIRLTEKFIIDSNKFIDRKNITFGGKSKFEELDNIQIKQIEIQLEIYKNEKRLYELFFNNFDSFIFREGKFIISSNYLFEERNKILKEINKQNQELDLYIKKFNILKDKKLDKYGIK